MRTYQAVAVQSRDDEVIQLENPNTDNVLTLAEEEMEAVVDEDIYCEDMVKDTIDNIFNDPITTTIQNSHRVLLDTSEICGKVT